MLSVKCSIIHLGWDFIPFSPLLGYPCGHEAWPNFSFNFCGPHPWSKLLTQSGLYRVHVAISRISYSIRRFIPPLPLFCLLVRFSRMTLTSDTFFIEVYLILFCKIPWAYTRAALHYYLTGLYILLYKLNKYTLTTSDISTSEVFLLSWFNNSVTSPV